MFCIFFSFGLKICFNNCEGDGQSTTERGEAASETPLQHDRGNDIGAIWQIRLNDATTWARVSTSWWRPTSSSSCRTASAHSGSSPEHCSSPPPSSQPSVYTIHCMKITRKPSGILSRLWKEVGEERVGGLCSPKKLGHSSAKKI